MSKLKNGIVRVDLGRSKVSSSNAQDCGRWAGSLGCSETRFIHAYEQTLFLDHRAPFNTR